MNCYQPVKVDAVIVGLDDFGEYWGLELVLCSFHLVNVWHCISVCVFVCVLEMVRQCISRQQVELQSFQVKISWPCSLDENTSFFPCVFSCF